MQFLQEIIGLSYIHFYPEVEEFLPQGAKNQQLYQAIRSGEVATDQEASRLIYGSDSAGKKYIMLKQRLKQQVTDNYFKLLSRTNEVSPSPVQRRLDYLKQLAIIYTLMGQGRYSLARQLLYYQQKAATAQFDLAAAQEGLYLLRQIAGHEGDRTAFRRCDQQLEIVTKQANWLREAQGYYEAVRLEHRRHLPPSAAVAELAFSYASKVQQWQQDNSHPVINFYGRLLKLIAWFHRGDLTRCRRILFFQQQQMKRFPLLTTYDPLASADLLSMQYLSTMHPETQSWVVQQTIDGSRDESLPAAAWLRLREVECIHWLRTTDYKRAEQVCQQLRAEAEGETFIISPRDQARWSLFNAYASYLRRSTQEEDNLLGVSRESVAMIEAAVQPLLTDTTGYGWQWFVLKLMLWIEDPFLPAKHFLRQIDAYARRHLPGQPERGVAFFQKIRPIIAGQHRIASEENRLLLPKSSDNDSLRELIPYEILWESVDFR